MKVLTPILRGLVSACTLALLLATQVPHSAQALSATWNGTSDSLWATTGNWSTSPVPGSGDTATFNNAGGAVDTISLAGITIRTLLFDTDAATYTLGSGAINSETLTLNNGGAITLNPTVTNNQLLNAAVVLGTDGSAQTFTLTNSTSAKTLTCAGNITGSTGSGVKTLAVSGSGPIALSGAIANGASGTIKLTKSGTGSLILTNTANTYTGGIVINGTSGTVTATATNGTNVTGMGTGAVSIGSGSILNLLSAHSVGSATTINNTFTGTGTLKFTFTDTTAATYSVLGGVSGFTGTIQLSNTTTSNKDKWYANNIGAINAALIIDNASQIFVANGPATFNSVSVIGTGNAEGYGAIRLGNTLNGIITLAGNTTIGLGGGTITGAIRSGTTGIQTLTLGTTAAAGTGTFSGNIGGGAGIIAVTSAAGTSTLSGSNTYTGNTLVSSGTLKLGNNLALQNSVLDTSGAGTLAFASGINTPTIGGLTGNANLTLAANVTALTLNTASGVTTTYSGTLGSATAGMSLIKTGSGTQVLSGSNTFTGPTLVNQGTLRIAPRNLPSLPSGLRIMPLGDSITNGSGSAATAGYRYPLYILLNSVAPGFQFVGDSSDNSSPMPASPVDQRYHAGHSSYACNDISNNLDGLDTAVYTQYGGTSRDPHGGYWFTGGNGTGRAALYPDVILLLCAANDISRVGMTGVQGRLEALLTKITTMRPDARVFLAKATPYAGYTSSVEAYNAIVDTVATSFQSAGKKITVVDLNTGFPAGQFVDGVHPNTTGYNWMANRWYDALVSVYGTYPSGGISQALATTSSVTVASGARLEGSGPIGGPLTVSGRLVIGTGTISAGTTTVTGTLDCELNASNSGLLSVTGDLTLTNATLAITLLNSPTASSYGIASYSGSLHGAFASLTGLPPGYTLYYDTGNKRVLVATYYQAWRLSNGLSDTNSSMALDPDGDGATNLAEYALGGNPLNGGDNGTYVESMREVAGQPTLTLTIATLSGASFVSGSGNVMVASAGGVTYQVESSHDLAKWTDTVAEITPAITSGLPMVPVGYEYHTFKAGAPEPGVTKGFLRLKLTATP